MIPLGIVALATLAANGSRQLRYSAVALLGVSLAANVVTAGQLTVSHRAVEGCGALVACGILYVAARDRTYGEDPGFFFFFNDTATTEIYTLSLHDALPISDMRSKSAYSLT